MTHILKQRLAYIVLFMAVIFGMTHGIARGEDIALANLPEIIRNAADKAIPNAKWNKVVKDTDGKDSWYEVSGMDAKGRKICVTVEPNGDIEEIETEIKSQNTPKSVMTALRGRLPNFKITAVYEIRNDQDKIIRYDIDGKRSRDKEDVTISFTVDGKFIKLDE
ncbi:MAG: hypothetical protein WCJ06_04970 [Planctomycetota bacterium]